MTRCDKTERLLVTAKWILLVFLVAGLFAGCDSDNPSYDQLKERNDELQAQLADTHQRIEQAKSDLDDLRSGIRDLEASPCIADNASDLDNRADVIESSLNEADGESQ
jgi:predicted  nucleic acid-binding Zn-ribbon protein